MTNAEARFNKSLRQRKPEGSLGRTAQDGHLDSHTAPELYVMEWCCVVEGQATGSGVGQKGRRQQAEAANQVFTDYTAADNFQLTENLHSHA